MQELTQEYLKECLSYDSDTGIFTWKYRDIKHFKTERAYKTWNTRFSGKISGLLNLAKGYEYIKINGKLYKSHRLAWFYIYGKFPENGIDHINGIKNDNRICNLRKADQSENMQNLKKAMASNKSTGLLGSYYRKYTKRYESRIKINGKNFNLGCFNTAQEAHEAYLKAKRNLHKFNTL